MRGSRWNRDARNERVVKRASESLGYHRTLGSLRSRAALFTHVLGKRIVHARLPTTTAGAEELHNMRI